MNAIEEDENVKRDKELYKYPDCDILRNIPDIKEQKRLDEFENEHVSMRILQGVPSGKFDLKHLKAIHKHLFQDVYEWAGELRKTNIHKSKEPEKLTSDNVFTFHQMIEAGIDDVHRKLVKKNFIKGLSHAEFAKEAALVIGNVNRDHPFRDGNGRTQLQYLKQLGQQAGYDVAIDKFERKEWIEASKAAMTWDEKPMEKVIYENSRPIDRGRSERESILPDFDIEIDLSNKGRDDDGRSR